MKAIRVISIAALLFGFSGVSYSKGIDAKYLIKSCSNMVDIFDRKMEKKFLAGMTTSVSEALLAGVCLGMIAEHGMHNSCRKHPYDIAMKISKTTKVSRSRDNVERLLDKVCAS